MENKPFTLKDCLEERGKELDVNNQDIVKYLCSLQEERNDLAIIIEKQYLERKNIESEIEKLTYKLCLINKSLSQRIKAKNNYDKTIQEIEGNYDQLVEGSNVLKKMLEKQHNELDDLMNKKTGTGDDGNEEVKTLYARPPPTAGSTTEATDQEDCECVKKVPPPVTKCSTLRTPKISKLPQEEPTRDSGERRKSPPGVSQQELESVMKKTSALKAASAKLRSNSYDTPNSSSSIEKSLTEVEAVQSESKPPSISSTTSDTRKGRRRSGSLKNQTSAVYATDSPRNLHSVSYSEADSNQASNVSDEGETDTQMTTGFSENDIKDKR